MEIFLDNIIFSIQKSGGISVVWSELINRMLKDDNINVKFLDYPNKNNFRTKVSIPESTILHNVRLVEFPIFIQRYFNPSIVDGKGIFHSSYYRIVDATNIVNITTVHDFTYEYFRKGLPKLIHHNQKRIAIQHSKRIICVSHNTKKDILKFFPHVSEDLIKVIYNGVDEIYKPILKKDDTKLKQLIPFSTGEFVLYIGDRKSLYKNFRISVRACSIANLPLVIVGGGPILYNEFLLLKESLGINKFKLLPNVCNNYLNEIYNHALCLLYPSCHEGFGIPIVEAQKAGCPVISTNYSSIPEVAGKGAILINEITEFHIADILKQISRKLSLTSNIILEGFKNSKRFTWDQCYQQTKSVYKEVYNEYL